MSTPRTTQDQLFFDAGDLSFKLGELMGVVKLAAFAAEARRTLHSIEVLGSVIPAVRENLKFVERPKRWKLMEDNASDVLEHVAGELESIQHELDSIMAQLRRAATGSEAESLEGGRDE